MPLFTTKERTPTLVLKLYVHDFVYQGRHRISATSYVSILLNESSLLRYGPLNTIECKFGAKFKQNIEIIDIF